MKLAQKERSPAAQLPYGKPLLIHKHIGIRRLKMRSASPLARETAGIHGQRPSISLKYAWAMRIAINEAINPAQASLANEIQYGFILTFCAGAMLA
jgi:hypothetical protein